MKQCDQCHWWMEDALGPACRLRPEEDEDDLNPAWWCEHFRPSDLHEWRCGTCTYYHEGHGRCMQHARTTMPEYKCSKWEGEQNG